MFHLGCVCGGVQVKCVLHTRFCWGKGNKECDYVSVVYAKESEKHSGSGIEMEVNDSIHVRKGRKDAKALTRIHWSIS